MNRLLNLIFGCRHRRRSFPLTIRHETYVSCLDCGVQHVYDWERFRVTKVRVCQ